VASKYANEFPHIWHVDTSFVAKQSPNFQQIAYLVAERIVKLIEGLSTQMLLVTKPVNFNGFEQSPDKVETTVEQIINNNQPQFLERPDAESTLNIQQVVPYAVLVDDEGRYFYARRRSDAARKELQGKYTLLVGGHAEQRDWNPDEPRSIFETCLRREIEEELIGVQLGSIEALGFIHDVRNRVGCHHLAFIHRVQVGGRAKIRRQAIDQEFSRETVDWKTPEEISLLVRNLDPWSQFVASKLFGAVLPHTGEEPTLFAPEFNKGRSQANETELRSKA